MQTDPQSEARRLLTEELMTDQPAQDEVWATEGFDSSKPVDAIYLTRRQKEREPAQGGETATCYHVWFPIPSIKADSWPNSSPLFEICRNDCGAIRQSVTSMKAVFVPEERINALEAENRRLKDEVDGHVRYIVRVQETIAAANRERDFEQDRCSKFQALLAAKDEETARLKDKLVNGAEASRWMILHASSRYSEEGRLWTKEQWEEWANDATEELNGIQKPNTNTTG